MKKIKKAVITAAGWGTRFLPVTKSQPKEMLPLVNKPLIQYSVEEAVACGMELVVIVTALGKRAIEDHFDRSFELEQVLEQKGNTSQAEEIRRLSNIIDITYIRQKEQIGLGHAVLSARKIIGDDPFVLMLPDDIFEQQEHVLKKMMEIYRQYQGCVIAVQRVNESKVSRYGIINPEGESRRVYKVRDMVEKPKLSEAPSDLAIMGRYVLVPKIFDVLTEVLPGKNGEIQLTDGLKQLMVQHPVYAYEFEGERYDAGTPLGWLQTNLALGLKDPDIGSQLKNYVINSLSQMEKARGSYTAEARIENKQS